MPYVCYVGDVDLSSGGHFMGVNNAIKGDVATESTNNSESPTKGKL